MQTFDNPFLGLPGKKGNHIMSPQLTPSRGCMISERNTLTDPSESLKRKNHTVLRRVEGNFERELLLFYLAGT